jgi:hypothetical protein
MYLMFRRKRTFSRFIDLRLGMCTRANPQLRTVRYAQVDNSCKIIEIFRHEKTPRERGFLLAGVGIIYPVRISPFPFQRSL